MYKKLILTFTLAAGLSVLPNAFAAPSTKPGPAPKPNTTKTTTQFKDSIDVLAAARPPQQPMGPKGKGRHGEDRIDVLAADIPPAPEPKDFKRPGRPPKGRHGEDSATVLAWKKPPPKGRHSEDSTIV